MSPVKIRDPARIDYILEKLRIYWEANPDLRLGQIISNIASRKACDPFYIEDSILIHMLESDIEELRKE